MKGRSLEGLGALAGGSGVAVQAVCLVERAQPPAKGAAKRART